MIIADIYLQSFVQYVEHGTKPLSSKHCHPNKEDVIFLSKFVSFFFDLFPPSFIFGKIEESCIEVGFWQLDSSRFPYDLQVILLEPWQSKDHIRRSKDPKSVIQSFSKSFLLSILAWIHVKCVIWPLWFRVLQTVLGTIGFKSF
jgi:hypothetical protein